MHQPSKQNLVHYSCDRRHGHYNISPWSVFKTSEKKQQNTIGKHVLTITLCHQAAKHVPHRFLFGLPIKKGCHLSFSFFLLFSETNNTMCPPSPKQCHATEKPLCSVRGLHISNCELALGNSVHPLTT